MAARFGIVVYWLGCILALPFLYLATRQLAGEAPLSSFVPIGLAICAWGAGRTVKFVLAGY